MNWNLVSVWRRMCKGVFGLMQCLQVNKIASIFVACVTSKVQPGHTDAESARRTYTIASFHGVYLCSSEVASSANVHHPAMPSITNNMPSEYEWCWWTCHASAVACYFSMCVVTAFMAWQQICLFQVFYVKLYETACCKVLPILQVCTKSMNVKTSLLIPCAVTAECMTIFFPAFHLKQNATDSSSNSSQKREQPMRTLASPASCEHRRICTRGHLHDHYSSDHYHLEQVRFLLSAVTWRALSAVAETGCLVPPPTPERLVPPFFFPSFPLRLALNGFQL